MILQSKLNKDAYPMADPDRWVSGDKSGIDPILLGRLAYFGKSNNKVIVITQGGGYRSYEDQVKMYNLYKAGKLQATAAVPGTSWHGSRLAVDTSTQPIRGMASAQLAKYGLCKPIKNEGWHIQPIETINMGVRCNMSLAPVEMEDNDLTKEETMALIKEALAGTGTEPSGWAKESWNQAKADGMTDGTNPKGYVTKEQVVVMIERAKVK